MAFLLSLTRELNLTQSLNVRWMSGTSPCHPQQCLSSGSPRALFPHATSMNTSPFPKLVNFCGFYSMCIRRSMRRSSEVTCAYGPEHSTPFLTRSVMTPCPQQLREQPAPCRSSTRHRSFSIWALWECGECPEGWTLCWSWSGDCGLVHVEGYDGTVL